MRRGFLAYCAIIFTASFHVLSARAQTTTPNSAEPSAVKEPFVDASLPTDTQQLGGWRDGEARPFLAARTDIGFLFLKPRLSVGYGRPHYQWLGLDVNPLLSTGAVGGYLGARAMHPNADLRVGGRYAYAIRRSYLEPARSYDALALESRVGQHASYFSLEAEFSYDLPLGPGSIVGEIAGTRVMGVPKDYYVFEDTLSAVIAPPYAWRNRLGYSWVFGFRRAFKLSLVGEVLGSPKRDLLIYRGGGIVSLQMSRALQVRAFAIPVLVSRDSLGAVGGDTFGIGLRHYWASGD